MGGETSGGLRQTGERAGAYRAGHGRGARGWPRPARRHDRVPGLRGAAALPYRAVRRRGAGSRRPGRGVRAAGRGAPGVCATGRRAPAAVEQGRALRSGPGGWGAGSCRADAVRCGRDPVDGAGTRGDQRGGYWRGAACGPGDSAVAGAGSACGDGCRSALDGSWRRRTRGRRFRLALVRFGRGSWRGGFRSELAAGFRDRRCIAAAVAAAGGRSVRCAGS